MKKYFISLLLLMDILTAVAQKPPTQKEMDEMMKEMQKHMPSMKSMPKFSDKQLADAWNMEAPLVPKKNLAAIAAIPQTPTVAALPAYISSVHNAVALKLSAADRTNADNIYKELNSANAAIGFWMQGDPLLATYLMGKACQAEPQNVNHINNFAAMLSMNGAQHLALPILNNLDKRFPKNSTVLNNIGQAWFSLGDIDKAGRYLDSAIRIYAYHSQANYTKSHIEESKGNKEGAAEAMIRSVKKSHSADKENRLNKLGRKLSGKDIDFPFPLPQDPLGLEKFTWPEYPMTVYDCETLKESWEEFIANCEAELQELNAKSAQLEHAAAEAMQKRMTSIPAYAQVAALKLHYASDERQLVKTREDVMNALQKNTELEQAMADAEKKLREKYDPLIGEGRANPLDEYCSAVNEVRNKYLQATNSQLRMAQRAALEVERKWMNNQVYYQQYINWPEAFEVIKIQAKIRWLNMIKSQVVKFQSKGFHCREAENKKPSSAKLQEFDDVACQYHSSIDLIVWEFSSDCRYFTGKLKLGKLNYTRKIDSDNHSRLLAATLEIKVGASAGWEKGPVQAELAAEINGRLEWNETEITNWEVSSEVGVSAGSNLGYKDKSIDIAGVKATIGMNSSGRVQGSGLLQNLRL